MQLAETKDLPYGTYTVHQTKGWDGTEFLKDFDVFINENGKTYKYLINNAGLESYVKIIRVDSETGKADSICRRRLSDLQSKGRACNNEIYLSNCIAEITILLYK